MKLKIKSTPSRSIYGGTDALKRLMGTRVGLAGVCGNRFKLFVNSRTALVFEAIEDADDGYRSYLKSVRLANEEGCTFFNRPIVWATLQDSNQRDANARAFVDDKGHTWLTIGTDYSDDYYPSFIFRWSPPALPVTLCPHCGK